MMNKLPSHLLNEIFFILNLKSVAKLRCVNKSLYSHLSDDLIFQSEYFSRLGINLLNISTSGSKLHSLISSTKSPSSSFKPPLIHYYIIGSSSGLLLLYIDGLCVANPLTKKFKFINHSSAKLFPNLLFRDNKIPSKTFIKSVEKRRIGFAVDRIDRNKQRFKIVCLFNELAPNGINMIYKFEIYSEDSWRLSQTRLICSAIELYEGSHSIKPVYVNGCLHWLRIDGSVIVFNPEFEEARLISVDQFPKEVNSKLGFCVGANRVKLICVSEEKICIYVLEMENILIRRWNLVKEMENNVKIEGVMIHEIENKWKVLGSIPHLGDKSRDFYMFKPGWDSVVGLNDMLMMNDDDDNDVHGRLRLITLRTIIRIFRHRFVGEV